MLKNKINYTNYNLYKNVINIFIDIKTVSIALKIDRHCRTIEIKRQRRESFADFIIIHNIYHERKKIFPFR